MIAISVAALRAPPAGEGRPVQTPLHAVCTSLGSELAIVSVSGL